ncbi:SDR family oxidoreductase [Thioclava sp. GXIMD2076]|uniref:SDR family oxidoreductase n=1 Tax=Thioclava kandeliae TaxID=3070818 RepID=A0ABV1SK58_9RHOB
MKTAIVTGAASGIGRAIALRLVKEGWQVAALDIDEEALATLPHEMALWDFVCDLGDEASVKSAVEQAGFDRLDLLVNNGGPADPFSGPIETMTLADWDHWLEPHLTGTFLMVRECAPALKAARGAVVNMASTRAFQSQPQTYGYAAAKGGVVALTHALAVGMGPDVRVNAIAPGWIDTVGEPLSPRDHMQHPVGRVGLPEDIADAVMYLAGAGFVTGQVLPVDGGMTRRMIYGE